MSERGKRKELVGTVISDKMQKTVVVESRRRVQHPTYGKVVVHKAKFYAHDAKGACKSGDVVRIRETRPLSRLKRWEVITVVRSTFLPELPAEGGDV